MKYLWFPEMFNILFSKKTTFVLHVQKKISFKELWAGEAGIMFQGLVHFLGGSLASRTVKFHELSEKEKIKSITTLFVGRSCVSYTRWNIGLAQNPLHLNSKISFQKLIQRICTAFILIRNDCFCRGRQYEIRYRPSLTRNL